jgi:PIN domain nuclease of toxin-antitoxin system
MKARVLLDTESVCLAGIDGLDAFPKKVRKVLEDWQTDCVVSAVSIMEVAIKNGVGKLEMGESEMRQAARDLRATIIPFTPQHAYQLFSLPLHHRDPFDRMLIATAMIEDMPLVGSDRKFRSYKGLKIIW